jgi:hypothetical protein
VPRSGVTYAGELEYRFAAQWAHYQWEDFIDLDGEDQSAIVASYRAYNQIEGVLATKANEKAKQAK